MRPLRRPAGAAAVAVAAVVALGSLLGPLVPASAQDGAPGASFGEAVDVRLVTLDVYATDRQGRPIQDLREEDFQVFEDGRKVDLSYFLAPTGAAASPAGETASAIPDSGGQAAQETEPEHLLVFVDSVHLAPGNRARLLDRLAEVLEAGGSQAPDRRLMLVHYDGDATVKLAFGASPFLVATALRELKGEGAGAASARALAKRQMLDALEAAIRSGAEQSQGAQVAVRSGAGAQGALSGQTLDGGIGERSDLSAAEQEVSLLMAQLRPYAEQIYVGVQGSLNALGHYVNALGGLPGRRQLLYVSDGLPLQPAREMVAAIQNAFRDGDRLRGLHGGARGQAAGGQVDAIDEGTGLSLTNLESEFTELDSFRQMDELSAFANAQQVTLHSLDAAGASPGLLTADVSNAAGGVMDTPAAFVSAGQTGDSEALRWLPQRTGGLALAGGSAPESLFETLDRSSESRYALGFEPTSSGTGVYRALEVKVARKGVRLRHRQGYVIKEDSQQMAERLIAALVLGTAHNPHRLELAKISESLREDGSFSVGLLLRIPLDNLTLELQADQLVAGLTLHVLTSSGPGDISPMRSVPLNIRFPATRLGEAQGKVYGAPVPVVLPPGEQLVAVGIWEPRTQRGSFLQRRLRVASGPES